jgi:hypothetical protein
MDTELLVDNRILDGQKLLAALFAAGFDVNVAFWAKTSEDGLPRLDRSTALTTYGLWSLYIGSTSVEPSNVGDGYRTLYSCLSKAPDSSVEMSEVQLIPASDPIAKEAVAARDRLPGRLPAYVRSKRLGNLSIEEAYIYPRIGGQMTRAEVLQTLFAMVNGPAGMPARPAVITLRGGNQVTVLITGFNLQMPTGLTIHTLDPTSNTKGQITGDEVTNIQAT